MVFPRSPKLRIIISILIFILLICSNSLYSSQTYKNSFQIIKDLQSSTPKSQIAIFLYISTKGLWLVEYITFAVFFLFLNRFKIFLLVHIFALRSGLATLLKNYYVEGRPFWDDKGIIGHGFQLGFGNPSGHVMIIMAFMLSLIFIPFNKSLEYDIVKGYPIINMIESKTNNHTNKLGICRIIINCALLILTMLNCYGRVVLGSHSIDQVLFGVLICLYIFIMCVYYFKDIIFAHFKKLLWGNYSKECGLGIAIYFILLIMQCIQLYLLYDDYSLTSQQIQNIQTYFPKSSVNPKAPLHSSYREFFSVPMGMYLGIWFSKKCLKVPNVIWEEKGGLDIYFKRGIIIILLAIPSFIINDWIIISKNTIIYVAFNFIFSELVKGFLVFGFGDYIYIRWTRHSKGILPRKGKPQDL